MPRVLHVIHDLDHGGAATQLRLLAEAGAARGDAVAVATLRRPGPVGDRLTARGIPVTWVGRRFRVDPFAAVSLRRLVRTSRPDVLQSWDNASAKLCRLARRRGGVAWIHTLRDGVSAGGWNAADGLIAADETLAAAIKSSSTWVNVVPNAFDPAVAPTIEADKLAARERLRAAGADVAAEAPVVVCATRIDDAAATKEIAWAADLVRVVKPGLRLLVAGDGAKRTACERFAAKAAEPGTVVWLGPWDNLPTLYAAADVVWCGRGAGAAPTPAVEAMAAGKPLVIAEAPGREALAPPSDTSSGMPWALPWDDRAGWARTTKRFLEDPELSRSIGRANAQLACAKHAIDLAADAHAAAVERAVTTGTAA